MRHDAFSVVIPAYNAMDTLPACLDALERAEPKPAEIVLFDDGSTDGTGDYARSRGARVITGDRAKRGPAHGRNQGVRAARNGLCVFVDADVAVAPDAPGLLAERVAAKGVSAAFGAYCDQAPVKRLSGRYANLRHHYTHKEAAHGEAAAEAQSFWSGLGAVDREAFLRVGGFDEALYDRPCIEDVELGLRLRREGRILLVPGACGSHLKDWTVGQLWHTDVFCRALPWSQLIAEGRIGDTLNTAGSEKAKSVLAHLVWVSALAALFVPFLSIAVAAFGAAYLFLNRGFFSLLARRSRRLAVAGAGLHWAYHVYASAVLGMVLIGAGFSTRMGRKSGVVAEQPA
jgi:GT2 family glycosyltransferase